MTVGGCAVEGVIGTFEVTIFIIGVSRSVQRVEVQAADEADVFGHQTVAVDVADVRLSDGIASFWAV